MSHKETRVFGPTIKPNSKSVDLLVFWFTLPVNVDFLTQLSCVIVYLLSKAQLCAFFGMRHLGGIPQNLRVVVIIVSLANHPTQLPHVERS